jgi:four helix bundle protein
MSDYRELAAWRAAHALALGVFDVTRAWPREERYGLTAQVRRAAFSVSVNLVEGSCRRGVKEFRRFVDIAIGSLAEVKYTLDFAIAAGIARGADVAALGPLAEETSKLCHGLARSLDRAAQRS